MSEKVEGGAYDADGARPPMRALARREWFVSALELGAATLSQSLFDHWPRGDGHAVVVVPGFLAAEPSTRFLRRFLERLGYRAYDWAQGRNMGPRQGMHERAIAQLETLNREHHGKVSLIGWSAGGIYAREVARARPDLVRHVITLGSPFRGNHLASRTWWLYALFNRGSAAAQAVSAEARVARAVPLTVPTTCLYSRLDGVVAWECCTSLPAPRTENIEVRSSHLGYGHNLEALHVVADRLALPPSEWRPYRRPDRG